MGDNLGQAVLNTLQPANVESRETPEQGIKLVYVTAYESICKPNSCITIALDNV